MSSIGNIIKASSAIGVFCSGAYFYFSKKPSFYSKFFNTNYISDQKSLNENMDLIKKLSDIENLSKTICSEINLVTPGETLKKSLSVSLLDKLNTNVSVHKNVQETLNNLSVRTKNDTFLYKFILQNGLFMLKDLLLYNEFEHCLNDEVHMTLSEVMANISQRKESIDLLEDEYIKKLLDSWFVDNNIVLNLNVVKVFSNMNELQKVNAKDITIYCPDIFVLDHESNKSQIKDFDIVFINGMLGSVYFTWRQYDEDVETDTGLKTKCWPRDWLSPVVPRARIVGINALLRPFVWNPMSNIDKMNRAIEDRAVELALKLEKAGVGRKPILWIVHSAGGILLKHILHISEKGPLAAATKGIMFMSTPHSGAQSMLGLYYFPFKYFLTPEAKHLERNSQVLLQLNNWFKNFVKDQNIQIVTLTETEPTKISKFYSTIIVPNSDGEFDDHEQLKIKSDHLYISKPKNQSDQIYVTVLNFIHKTMGRYQR